MACEVKATPGATDGNSYCSILDGDAYHDTHPYATTWDDAGDDEKCRALVTATRLLNQWFDWVGTQSTLTQKLPWPRRGVPKPNISEFTVAPSTNQWGEPFAIYEDDDAIPDRLRDACAEYARQLLVADRAADSDLETQGVSSVKVSSIELVFRPTAAKPVPDDVVTKVNVYGQLRSRMGGVVTLYRG